MSLIMNTETIGRNLYEIRKQVGITQETVAELADISSRTYADIERGAVNARLETILKICSVLRITPNDIMMEKKLPAAPQQEELIKKLNVLPYKEYRIALKLLETYIDSV